MISFFALAWRPSAKSRSSASSPLFRLLVSLVSVRNRLSIASDVANLRCRLVQNFELVLVLLQRSRSCSCVRCGPSPSPDHEPQHGYSQTRSEVPLRAHLCLYERLGLLSRAPPLGPPVGLGLLSRRVIGKVAPALPFPVPVGDRFLPVAITLHSDSMQPSLRSIHLCNLIRRPLHRQLV